MNADARAAQAETVLWKQREPLTGARTGEITECSLTCLPLSTIYQPLIPILVIHPMFSLLHLYPFHVGIYL